MPIFEYHCPECDDTFEVLRMDRNAPALCPCPACGELSPKKVSAFGFQFSQHLKELRSNAYIRGTNIKLEDVHKSGLIPAAKAGSIEAQKILGGKETSGV